MGEYFKITTKYGPAEIVATDAQHIYFDANKNCGTYDNVGLTIRGVRYGTSAHLYRWADGAFHVGQEGDRKGVYSDSLYMSRPRDYKRGVSESARRAAIEEIEAAVNVWALSNPAEFLAADIGSVENELESKKADLMKAQAEVDKLSAEVVALGDKLANLKGKVVA